MKTFKKAIIAISLFSLLAACSAETPANPKSQAPKEPISTQSKAQSETQSSSSPSLENVHRIRINERDNALHLSHHKLIAGNAKFVLDLPDRENHGIWIIKTDRKFEQLPIKNGNLDETDHSMKTIAHWNLNELKGNEKEREVLDLTPGRYVILYGEEGQFDSAQKAEFTVE